MPEVKRTVTLRAEWECQTHRVWRLTVQGHRLAKTYQHEFEFEWHVDDLDARGYAPTLDLAMQAAERALGAEVVEGGAE